MLHHEVRRCGCGGARCPASKGAAQPTWRGGDPRQAGLARLACERFNLGQHREGLGLLVDAGLLPAAAEQAQEDGWPCPFAVARLLRDAQPTLDPGEVGRYLCGGPQSFRELCAFVRLFDATNRPLDEALRDLLYALGGAGLCGNVPSGPPRPPRGSLLRSWSSRGAGQSAAGSSAWETSSTGSGRWSSASSSVRSTRGLPRLRLRLAKRKRQPPARDPGLQGEQEADQHEEMEVQQLDASEAQGAMHAEETLSYDGARVALSVFSQHYWALNEDALAGVYTSSQQVFALALQLFSLAEARHKSSEQPQQSRGMAREWPAFERRCQDALLSLAGARAPRAHLQAMFERVYSRPYPLPSRGAAAAAATAAAPEGAHLGGTTPGLDAEALNLRDGEIQGWLWLVTPQRARRRGATLPPPRLWFVLKEWVLYGFDRPAAPEQGRLLCVLPLDGVQLLLEAFAVRLVGELKVAAAKGASAIFLPRDRKSVPGGRLVVLQDAVLQAQTQADAERWYHALNSSRGSPQANAQAAFLQRISSRKRLIQGPRARSRGAPGMRHAAADGGAGDGSILKGNLLLKFASRSGAQAAGRQDARAFATYEECYCTLIGNKLFCSPDASSVQNGTVIDLSELRLVLPSTDKAALERGAFPFDLVGNDLRKLCRCAAPSLKEYTLWFTALTALVPTSEGRDGNELGDEAGDAGVEGATDTVEAAREVLQDDGDELTQDDQAEEEEDEDEDDEDDEEEGGQSFEATTRAKPRPAPKPAPKPAAHNEDEEAANFGVVEELALSGDEADSSSSSEPESELQRTLRQAQAAAAAAVAAATAAVGMHGPASSAPEPAPPLDAFSPASTISASSSSSTFSKAAAALTPATDESDLSAGPLTSPSPAGAFSPANLASPGFLLAAQQQEHQQQEHQQEHQHQHGRVSTWARGTTQGGAQDGGGAGHYVQRKAAAAQTVQRPAPVLTRAPRPAARATGRAATPPSAPPPVPPPAPPR